MVYISGATGTGKTRGVLEKNGYSNVYRVTDYLHPFDSYNGQPVIAFDELRSSLRIKEMLLFCDIYPIELPSRYTNKYACYNKVYIISNWSLEKQYYEVQKDDKESWEASVYFGIGQNKLRELTNSDSCPYVIWCGNKRLIKRKLFLEYLEKMYSI